MILFIIFFNLIVLVLFLWAVARFKLAGPDHSQFDEPVGEVFPAHEDDALAIAEFAKVLKAVHEKASGTKSIKKGLAVAREFADNLSQGLESDCEFRPVVANGVTCEWTIAPGVDPQRRFIFFHGGAFVFGSPKGHRLFTHRLSHMANAAVLSVDYRMMPENSRMAATVDAQNAYHWILVNGPDGATPLDKLFVAGDSAGGNLTMMISTWSKTGAARVPDAAIGFSPATDTTMASPTVLKNAPTDMMLGKPIGSLAKLPKTISAWLGLILMRTNPSNILISPLFAELDNLPPTLIHASDSELLLGDAIRYTNKAKAAGSDVTLQIWPGQIHDWHSIYPDVGSGAAAWKEIEKFLAKF